MATKAVVWHIWNTILLIKTVAGYYCDSDKCKETEYCCGENICCASYTVWELWYFWFGIVLFLVLLSMCVCLWKSRYRDRRILMSYSLVSNKQHQANKMEGKTDVFSGPVVPGQNKYQPLQNAPPTFEEALEYSQAYKGSHNK